MDVFSRHGLARLSANWGVHRVCTCHRNLIKVWTRAITFESLGFEIRRSSTIYRRRCQLATLSGRWRQLEFLLWMECVIVQQVIGPETLAAHGQNSAATRHCMNLPAGEPQYLVSGSTIIKFLGNALKEFFFRLAQTCNSR